MPYSPSTHVCRQEVARIVLNWMNCLSWNQMEFLQQFSKFNYSNSCLAILLTYRLVAFFTLGIKLNLFHDLELFSWIWPWTFFMDFTLNLLWNWPWTCYGFEIDLFNDIGLEWIWPWTFSYDLIRLLILNLESCFWS